MQYPLMVFVTYEFSDATKVLFYSIFVLKMVLNSLCHDSIKKKQHVFLLWAVLNKYFNSIRRAV